MGSPDDLKDYIEHDCKSETITGELVGLYANIQDLSGAEDLMAVTACRDVESYSESLLTCAHTAACEHCTRLCRSHSSVSPLNSKFHCDCSENMSRLFEVHQAAGLSLMCSEQ